MENQIKIENNLLSFPKLEKLGIGNFATFNNKLWGSMPIGNPDNIRKYQELFKGSKQMIYLAPDHNDNVQLITAENLVNYNLFNKHELSTPDFTILTIATDSIITKESIPLFVTPADCSIIILTGIDKKDGRRFVAFIHAGIWGTMLKIHTKTLDLVQHYFDVDPAAIAAFLFPNVSHQHYKKNKVNDPRAKLLSLEEWHDFVYPEAEVFGIDIEGKIVSDLMKKGIKEISITGLDTYEENEKGNLFSFTYTKAHNLEKSNFGVGAFIK